MISGKTRSVTSSSFFTSSFNIDAFVSSAVCIQSFFNLVKKLNNHFACNNGSHPLTVTHHLSQKYHSSFSIIAMSCSSLISFHHI
ncbi:MAG: hypothetical protein WCG25_01625 [bacterium]